jgi:glycosyltransferase involved in cell wall biosynthesis
MVSEFDARFTTAASVTNWIAEKIDRIGPERVTWVKGAVEERKRNLYICAHIFVFPSRYAVEAQPLVLLEAMAAGCAIITTRVGEIERILGPNEAYFLNRADAAELTEAIALLARDSELRSRLATAACRRFIAEFSKTRHIDAWEGLLEWEKDI